MALPLIIAAGAGIAALTGLYKGTKAVVDNSNAGDINKEARQMVDNSRNELEEIRQLCHRSLKNLGKSKIRAYRIEVQNFLDTFGKIKNVEFTGDKTLGNMRLNDNSPELIDKLQKEVSLIVSSGMGLGTGAVGGALTAFGAYSGTMAFAAAGTGTAISSLSGAAATNATLAWLGGGTLAAGGMGVAGGMMALSALTAGPALLIAGWYMGAKAETNLNNARGNLEIAKKFVADVAAAIALTDGIRQTANKAQEMLNAIRAYSHDGVEDLKKLIRIKGTDFRQYEETEKLVVMRNVKIIEVMRALIETPILDEKGNLLGDVDSNLVKLQEDIDKYIT